MRFLRQLYRTPFVCVRNNIQNKGMLTRPCVLRTTARHINYYGGSSSQKQRARYAYPSSQLCWGVWKFKLWLEGCIGVYISRQSRGESRRDFAQLYTIF